MRARTSFPARVAAALERRDLQRWVALIMTAKQGKTPVDCTRLKIISNRAVLTPGTRGVLSCLPDD